MNRNKDSLKIIESLANIFVLTDELKREMYEKINSISEEDFKYISETILNYSEKKKGDMNALLSKLAIGKNNIEELHEKKDFESKNNIFFDTI